MLTHADQLIEKSGAMFESGTSATTEVGDRESDSGVLADVARAVSYFAV